MPQIAASFQFHPGDTQMTRAAIQTSDGGFILVGDTQNEDQVSSGVVIKANQWQKILSGETNRAFTAVAELSDQSLIAVGYLFYSEMAGDEHLWIVKLSPEGEILWKKNLGGRDEKCDGNAVVATSDGGFMVAALKIKHQSVQPNTWILKFNADGEVLWETTIKKRTVLALKETSAGNFICSGSYGIKNSFDSYVWATMLDPDGNQLWSHVYRRQKVYVLIESDVAETPEHNFIIVGKEFVMKINPIGQVIWLKHFRNLIFDTVTVAPNGDLLLGGKNIDDYYLAEAYVRRTTANPEELLWENLGITNNSDVDTVMLTPADNVVIAGSVPISNEASDMYLCIFRN